MSVEGRSGVVHQVFHVSGTTDPKVQIEKIERTGEFGFFHDHRYGAECNPGCHAIMASKEKRK